MDTATSYPTYISPSETHLKGCALDATSNYECAVNHHPTFLAYSVYEALDCTVVGEPDRE